jgi:uncharacterized protein (DUF1697 family)
VATDRFVCLLRGINVGGKNVIPMAALRARFEALGAAEVATYIASGNVVFTAKRASPVKLAARIEKALCDAFGYDARVVLLSAEQVAQVIDEAPPGFGAQAAKYRYDVAFVRPPVTARAVLPELTAKVGVDTIAAGTHAIYFRRLTAKAAQSHLARITGKPVYQDLTLRNWNTSVAIAKLLGQRGRR